MYNVSDKSSFFFCFLFLPKFRCSAHIAGQRQRDEMRIKLWATAEGIKIHKGQPSGQTCGLFTAPLLLFFFFLRRGGKGRAFKGPFHRITIMSYENQYVVACLSSCRLFSFAYFVKGFLRKQNTSFDKIMIEIQNPCDVSPNLESKLGHHKFCGCDCEKGFLSSRCTYWTLFKIRDCFVFSCRCFCSLIGLPRIAGNHMTSLSNWKKHSVASTRNLGVAPLMLWTPLILRCYLTIVCFWLWCCPGRSINWLHHDALLLHLRG